MTQSGRLPDRVELELHAASVPRGPSKVSGPESMSPQPSSAVGSSERGTRRRPRVTGHRQLDMLASELSQREWSVIHSLDEHAFMTALQLRALHFIDHATDATAARIVRRVLRRLRERRVIEPLERRIGGVRAGSASYVWTLGPVGDRLLRLAAGDGVRRRRKEPSRYFLDHRLAVVDAHVQLVTAARVGAYELLDVQTEPRCWRSYTAGHGGSEVLKPDLAAVTATAEYEDRWFIEVDRGTESIPTLLHKCAQYEAYRRTGKEQQAHGVFPLVIWQLPSQARIDKLNAAVSASRSLARDLFCLTTESGLSALIAGRSDNKNQPERRCL